MKKIILIIALLLALGACGDDEPGSEPVQAIDSTETTLQTPTTATTVVAAPAAQQAPRPAVTRPTPSSVVPSLPAVASTVPGPPMATPGQPGGPALPVPIDQAPRVSVKGHEFPTVVE